MFENFENAKHAKMPVWAMPLIIASVAIHVVVFTGMWVKAMWTIEKLEVPKGDISIGVAPPPPPPPPPPPGGKKPETPKEIKPRKIKVTEPVQPVKQEDKPPEVQEESADEGGEEGGVEGGVAGGVQGGSLEGVLTAAPPPPPPPKPQAPQNVAPTALEAQRISGEKNIAPDDVTKTEIQRSGKTKIVASVKICLGATGSVASLNVLKASGFPAYDQKIQREMRNWRYRPFQINGKPAPVCTAVTFIYQQKG